MEKVRTMRIKNVIYQKRASNAINSTELFTGAQLKEFLR